MRIITIAAGHGHPIARFGSVAAHHLGGVRFSGDGGWTLLSIDAGGHLGRHPATLSQLFLVLDGSGWVSGEDAIPVPIQSGSAALWDAGEEHASGTDSGMRIAVLEAAFIDVP